MKWNSNSFISRISYWWIWANPNNCFLIFGHYFQRNKSNMAPLYIVYNKQLWVWYVTQKTWLKSQLSETNLQQLSILPLESSFFSCEKSLSGSSYSQDLIWDHVEIRFSTHCSIRSGRQMSENRMEGKRVFDVEDEESIYVPLSISRNRLSPVSLTLCYTAPPGFRRRPVMVPLGMQTDCRPKKYCYWLFQVERMKGRG